MNNLSFKWKLILGFALPLALMVGIALSVNNSIDKLLETQRWVKHTHKAIEYGDEITTALLDMETGLQAFMITGNRDFLSSLDVGEAHYEELRKKARAEISDDSIQTNRLDKLEKLKANWMRTHVQPSIAMREQANQGTKDFSEIVALVNSAESRSLTEEMRKTLNEFVEYERRLVLEREDAQHETAESATNITSIGALLALILGALASFWITRNLTQQIGGDPAYAIKVANRIANNDLDEDICTPAQSDRSLLAAMKAMRDNILARSQQDRKLMDEMSRIKLALDVCNTNVMMADNNYNIDYMNDSVQKMMSAAESDLRKDLPSFKANELMGQSIDLFHKNPAHQRSMLETLKDVYRGEIVVGGRTFGLIATPIFDDRQQRLGTVVEWNDRTEQLAAEKEAKRIADDNARIKMALDVCDTNVMMADDHYNIVYMNEAVQAMMIAAEGDLRKELPNLDARNLVGKNIDIFHKNPAHQRSMLEKLTNTYRTDIVVGGRTFGLIATPIFNNGRQRLGTVVEWNDKTERLAFEREQEQLAADNARIKQALDNVSANVMVADADRNIIYANAAVVNVLRNAQNDLRKDLPNFDVDKMLGANIDQFHKNPAHQMNILDKLTGTVRTKIVVGGRHMHLIVNPVVDANGKRLGTVVEWADKTTEVNIQNELDGIIAAANDGILSERITMEGKEGFFADISAGLNTLLDKTSDFVSDVGDLFSAMAEGDLTRTISSDYRGEFEVIKSNANNSMAKMSEVLTRIQAASMNVRTSATEVAQGSDDLSRRTESQASSLEETASSMEEITATVRQTSDNAIEANDLAEEARSKASTGGDVVSNAVSAMSEILDSSNKINDIIGVIDEIAFQTNLLALNAAVEAARAGEQGRGFAVVAGEVRTLSQRSAAAAKEIKDLIRDSVSKVESGSKLVNQSGQTLTEIVEAVEKVATMISDVTTATKEQNNGIGQINQAIAQMDEMTQQNAALVEEASAASRSMSEEATTMSNMISFFKLGQGYGGSPAQASANEPIKSYQPSSQTSATSANPTSSSSSNNGQSGAASFADDDWEDF